MDRFAVASVIGSTGALHTWHGGDGNPRRVQSGCNAGTPGSMTSMYDGARLIGLAQAKSGSTTIVTFDLSRSASGPSSRCGGPETTLTALTSSRDDAFLAGGGASGRVYLWHYASGRLLACFDAHLGGVSRLAFTPDGSVLLSTGADAAVLAWPVHVLADAKRDRGAALRPAVSLRGHALPVCALAVGRGAASARVVTGSSDRSMRIWHVGSARETGHVSLPCAPVDIALSLFETHCYVALQNGDVLVVTVNNLPANVPVSHTGMPKLRPPPAADGKACPAVSSLALSPTDEEVIVGYSDGIVRIFDGSALIMLREYSRHNVAHPVSALLVLYPIPPALHDASTAAVALVDSNGSVEKQELTAIGASRAASLAMTIPAPVLAKTERKDEAFIPTVWIDGTSDVVGEAWLEIEGPEWAANEADSRGIGQEIANGVSAQVMEEVERLRARNKELEKVGTQLCDMVDVLTDCQ